MNDRLTVHERHALIDAAYANLADVTSHREAYLFGMLKAIITDEQVRYLFARTQEIKEGK